MEAVSVDMGTNAPIHALRTKKGIMFSMSQVAVELFNENPGAFGKEMRRGRYPRTRVLDKVVLMRLAQLGIPPESINVAGATLLPPESLLRVLEDKRRTDLVPKLRTAILWMITKEVADLIARGQFEEALPIVMDAVMKGQALYWPHSPLSLVPVYLLAVQVNLGLSRPVQSEDLLGVGSWLLLQDQTDEPKDSIHSELSRLFGQLSMLNNNPEPSLKAFAEEIYYKSQEFGIYDVRTSVAFYSLSKVFYALKQMENASAFWDIVIYSWKAALQEVILKELTPKVTPWGKTQFAGELGEFLDTKQAISKLIITEVCEMLQDICRMRSELRGAEHVSVGEACFVVGLAFMQSQKKMLALEHLHKASDILKEETYSELHDLITKAINILLEPTPRMFPPLAAPPPPAASPAATSPPAASPSSPAAVTSPTSASSSSPPDSSAATSPDSSPRP